jgi:hypothetical protein
MPKLNLDLDYNFTPNDAKVYNSPVETSVSYIYYAVKQKHPNGIKIDNFQGRVWSRLARQLDEAAANNTLSIEVEQAALDLIKTSFKDLDFPTGEAKYGIIMMDEVDRVSKGEPEAAAVAAAEEAV